MNRFRNILFIAPQSDDGGAMGRAAELALRNQARLTVVALSELPPFGPQLSMPSPMTERLCAAIADATQSRLERLVAPWRDRLAIETRILAGNLYLEVVREVLRNGYDLLMKMAGSGGPPLGRLLGSDDMHLLRLCPVPVWLMRSDEPPRYRRILAAVDLDEAYAPRAVEVRRDLNLLIMEYASSLAAAEGAELHVVYAWRAYGESEMRGGLLQLTESEIAAHVGMEERRHRAALERLLQEWGERPGARELPAPAMHLPKGWGRDEIPAVARAIDADLVVLGTVARSGISGVLIGNTAEVVLHRLECSMLALKPPGFITPVTLQE